MSCSNSPSSSPITFDVAAFFSNNCFQCADNGCPSTPNSKCVFYAGPNLPCSGIATNDSIELSLQKIDAQICSAIGDYSTYQFNCLTTWFGQSITQESQFVDAITGYACSIASALQAFTGVTFPAFQQDVTNMFDTVTTPTVTCASAGVISSDTLQTILTKYCTKFGEIDDALSIAGVTWNACLTVITPPSTIAQAFSLVEDQICQVLSSSGGALPTFNNTGSCLASPGTSDSLVSTIEKIKTRLCLSPTWNGNNIDWTCINPPSDPTSLEEGVQEIIDATTKLQIAIVNTYSNDFVVTSINPLDQCAGLHLALATPINQDRFVASNALDNSPGTLASKVTAGTNVTLDFLSTPGQMIINAASAALDYKLKADVTDPTPDFLDNKVEGGSDSGITISTSYNAINKKVDILPAVDLLTLFNNLLDELNVDSALKAKFCAAVSSCPCSCGTEDCTQYSVTNNSGSSKSVSYVDCTTGNPVTFSISDSSTIVLCAKTGSVDTGSIPLVTVTPIQSCAGGTTSTTTSTTTAAP